MTVRAAQIPVGTTAVKLNVTESDPSAGQTVAVKNIGGVTCYLGGASSVTASDGWPLAADEPIAVDIYGTEELWAVTAADSTTVATLASGA